MQTITRRRRVTLLLAASAGLGLSLAGCDKLTPNGQSDTMTLLKSGSEKVCIAPEVQKALRGLIVPKLDESASPELSEANKNFTVTFDLTTLQSADKAISKAVCNTVAKMAGLATGERTFQITYQVSPSAERPGQFVITGDTGAANDFASHEIGNIVAHQLAAKAQEQEAADAEKARQAMLATVTDRWLVGTWIAPADDASACANGTALTLQPDHTVHGRISNARWALKDGAVHLIGSMSSGSIDKTLVISEADAVSFKYGGNEEGSFRRCSRAEIMTTGLPDMIAPAAPSPN